MAFQNYEELINMADQNPKMARGLVNKAQQRGNPVVSRNNSGYDNPRMGALKRRFNAKKPDETQSEQMAADRKKVGY